MHLNKTEIAILKFFASRINKTYTVREIAKNIGQDYRITHESVNMLAAKGLIEKEKKANLNLCRLNFRKNISVLSYIESIIAQEFLEKNKDAAMIINDLLKSIKLPCFTMILFGSYAKGKKKKSDLDLLFLIPDRKSERNVSAAVSSIERITPVKIHDVILTYDEFVKMLEEKKINLAKEILDNHIIFYGSEAYYKTLEVI
jgi:predicted nucleotidyltransferase